MYKGTRAGITGVFVSLRRLPLRVGFRRRMGPQWERYDFLELNRKIDAAVAVIEELCRELPGFAGKLVSVDERYFSASVHRTRHYVNLDKSKLYPPYQTHLADRYSRSVAGVWLATNLGAKEIRQVIREACEAAEIEYGSIKSLDRLPSPG